MKKVGFIGLGKMGSPIVQRIIHAGFLAYVYDARKEASDALVKKGAHRCQSIVEMPQYLERPRVIFLCIPAGKAIDKIIKELYLSLSRGDIIIDLGNSFFQDTQKRAKQLKKKGIYLIDIGMSGGIDGARHGACLMVGGDEKQVLRLEEIFKAMSRKGSYIYLGKSGSGHLVKGYHNFIEYGYLQALAEGLESICRIAKKNKMNLKLQDVCDIYNKGSIVESRLIRDAKKAFQKDPSLRKVGGSVSGQTLDEMKKLIKIANEIGVKVYVCSAAVKARMYSQKKPTYSGKIINATRNIFGGHQDWKK